MDLDESKSESLTDNLAWLAKYAKFHFTTFVAAPAFSWGMLRPAQSYVCGHVARCTLATLCCSFDFDFAWHKCSTKFAFSVYVQCVAQNQ